MAGIPIIKPNRKDAFVERQGSLFMEDSYAYRATSTGILIRSLDECFYHRYLSFFGIAHTYEPDIEGICKRPDFGVGNNFLFELCRTDDHIPRKGDSRSVAGYKKSMAYKRGVYLDHGFNIVELYYNAVIINGKDASDKHVLLLIAKHNDHFRVPENRNLHFDRLKGRGKPWRLNATFHHAESEAVNIDQVIAHYKINRKYVA